MIAEMDGEVQAHRSAQTMPDDFDEFWRATIAEARTRSWAPRIRPLAAGLTVFEISDIEFAGFAGEPIRGWYRRPRGATGMPVVVRFTGYGAGRGAPTDDLVWAAAGYAELVVDTRGQGDGGTADGPFEGAGFLTRGLERPESYYYRRAFTDAAMAVAAARMLPGTDAERTATIGNSQGGGLAIAAAVLDGGVDLTLAQSPFLADIPRALAVGATGPWLELAELCRRDPRAEDWIEGTLPYFDVVNFARRAQTPVGLSCGLVDDIVPPSTTFAVRDAWAAERRFRAWPDAGHEAGASADVACALTMLQRHLGSRAPIDVGERAPEGRD